MLCKHKPKTVYNIIHYELLWLGRVLSVDWERARGGGSVNPEYWNWDSLPFKMVVVWHDFYFIVGACYYIERDSDFFTVRFGAAAAVSTFVGGDQWLAEKNWDRLSWGSSKPCAKPRTAATQPTKKTGLNFFVQFLGLVDGRLLPWNYGRQRPLMRRETLPLLVPPPPPSQPL